MRRVRVRRGCDCIRTKNGSGVCIMHLKEGYGKYLSRHLRATIFKEPQD